MFVIIQNNVCRLIRKEFILAKYIESQFAQKSGGSPDTQRRRLQEAIHARDIFSLLQLYTEKLDLSLPVPSPLQVHTHIPLPRFIQTYTRKEFLRRYVFQGTFFKA